VFHIFNVVVGRESPFPIRRHANYRGKKPPMPGEEAMSNSDTTMSEARADTLTPSASKLPRPRTSYFLREIPYGIVLLLTLAGVAYTSFSNQPIAGYWEFLVPLTGIVCVGNGWHNAPDKEARLRLVWTQILHWAAFLVAMNLVLFGRVQSMLNADATGLVILTLLALGTFVAGVHMLSWEICVLGVVMALCVPAIAWIEVSALILLLGGIVVVGIGVTLWWSVSRHRTIAARRTSGDRAVTS